MNDTESKYRIEYHKRYAGYNQSQTTDSFFKVIRARNDAHAVEVVKQFIAAVNDEEKKKRSDIWLAKIIAVGRIVQEEIIEYLPVSLFP